ncbi:MAG TPA: MBL fold metallo-hydrolase [Limnobacter sp.]|nr:MBL fold metallo-hydrolase [Limnobacter sp.]
MKQASATLIRNIFAAAVLGLSSVAAHAANPVPVQTTQAPGFYRMAVGDTMVTALYDGYINLAPGLLKGLDQKQIQSMLARMFLQTDPGVQTAVNAYLVHTPNNLVLVDAGSAQCFGPTLGNVLNNLKAAGYKPEQVDTVLLTHMHPDHVCGLVDAQGQAVFANATVHGPKGDADFWLNAEAMAKAPEGNKPFFQMAQKSLGPYQAAGKFKTFDKAGPLLDGFAVVPTPGHTPGHSSFLLTSGKTSMLIWGDVLHSHAVQFAKPEVTIEFDTDSKQAIASRKASLADLAKNGWLVAASHLPFPGIGRVAAEGKAYRYVPIEFGPVATTNK